MASILSIVYQPIGMEYTNRIAAYNRIPIVEARLITNHGIEGDQKAGHHPDRQLNLLSEAWLSGVQTKGFKINPGQFGEQIVVEGLNFEKLPGGTELLLGEEAVIRITKPRTGCERLEAAQAKTIAGIGPIGVLAQVVRGGSIKVGDPVNIKGE
jgi:MOSC domain-containing protein YiiM